MCPLYGINGTLGGAAAHMLVVANNLIRARPPLRRSCRRSCRSEEEARGRRRRSFAAFSLVHNPLLSPLGAETQEAIAATMAAASAAAARGPRALVEYVALLDAQGML